jgi:peptidoglycan hydrolase-like amidase
MKMARSGFSYDQILRFYFPGSVLKNTFEEQFLRQQVKRNVLNDF